jgi:hypothetical protein
MEHKIYDVIGQEVKVGDIITLAHERHQGYIQQIGYVRNITKTQKGTPGFVEYLVLFRKGCNDWRPNSVVFDSEFYTRRGNNKRCRASSLQRGAVKITDKFTQEQIDSLKITLIN